jgi:hypothetical protein
LQRQTGVLGHGTLNVNFNGACASGYEHDLSSLNIANVAASAPFYSMSISGFWLNGTSPSLISPGTAAAAMQAAPVTLRFFQDGKLILHLESDSVSNFNTVSINY